MSRLNQNKRKEQRSIEWNTHTRAFRIAACEAGGILKSRVRGGGHLKKIGVSQSSVLHFNVEFPEGTYRFDLGANGEVYAAKGTPKKYAREIRNNMLKRTRAKGAPTCSK